MLQMIRKQIRVIWRDCLWTFLAVLIGWCVGFGLLALLMTEDGSSYLTMGTLIGVFMAVMLGLVGDWIGMGLYFNTQVSLGCTRKEFFWSYSIVKCLMNFVCLGILLLLGALEDSLCRAIYQVGREVDLLYWILRAGPWAALAVPGIGMLCGALVMRFGKKAQWVTWGVWMFGCLAVPRIIGEGRENTPTVFGAVGRFCARIFGRVPSGVWLLAAAAAILLCYRAVWELLKKQQVT